jgi:hypothetical protein
MDDEQKQGIAKLRFLALIDSVAGELGGTFAGQPDWQDRIYQEYSKLVPAPNKKNWPSEQICPLFQCVDDPPNWVCDPEWPFHDGHPMVFIKQISVDDTERIRGILTVDAVLFVFGALEPVDGGKRQVYKIVEQLRDFKGF